MRHPLLALDLLEPELGLEPTERRAVSEAARERATMTDRLRHRRHPDGLVPPRRRRLLEGLAGAVPWMIGSATLVAFVWVGWRPRTLAAVLVLELVALTAFTLWASGRAFLPWRWAILRERGRDVCLHCGAQAGGDPRTETRCAECGRTSPPTPPAAPAADAATPA